MDALPIEVILEVLRISEPNTIATFLRTASPYRDAAEPLLYNSIVVKGPEVLQGLLNSLIVKPRFASRVRHLKVQWRESEGKCHHVLTPLLEKTENLECLILRGFREGIHLPCSLIHLQDVECDCFPYHPKVVYFLCKIPNLRRITVNCDDWSWSSNASLENIWADVLTKVTIYSGP